MNKKKGFSKSNTNFNSFLNDYEQNPNRKKEQTSKESTIASSTVNIGNNLTKTSNDIIDIDDSPDIATWNKVTRNKMSQIISTINTELPK
jgi:hypothetical protein